MPNPKGQTLPRAIAGKKRHAAARLEARAARLRREADELEAEARRRDQDGSRFKRTEDAS